MRLIDADDLTRKIEKSYLTKGEKRLFLIKVRHMDTVDISDAKYLEERDADAYESGYLQGHIEGYQKAEKDYAPTIGEWLCITKSTFPQYQPDEYVCSQCNIFCHIKYYFCPFCGAKMKGGAE